MFISQKLTKGKGSGNGDKHKQSNVGSNREDADSLSDPNNIKEKVGRTTSASAAKRLCKQYQDGHISEITKNRSSLAESEIKANSKLTAGSTQLLSTPQENQNTQTKSGIKQPSKILLRRSYLTNQVKSFILSQLNSSFKFFFIQILFYQNNNKAT